MRRDQRWRTTAKSLSSSRSQGKGGSVTRSGHVAQRCGGTGRRVAHFPVTSPCHRDGWYMLALDGIGETIRVVNYYRFLFWYFEWMFGNILVTIGWAMVSFCRFEVTADGLVARWGRTCASRWCLWGRNAQHRLKHRPESCGPRERTRGPYDGIWLAHWTLEELVEIWDMQGHASSVSNLFSYLSFAEFAAPPVV